MRWPRLTRRRRNEAPRIQASGEYCPGSWGQPVLAPLPNETANDAATSNVSIVAPLPVEAPAAGVLARPSPRAAPVAPEPGAEAGVCLGFADGTDVQLDPDHPHSLALKAVADVLLYRGPTTSG